MGSFSFYYQFYHSYLPTHFVHFAGLRLILVYLVAFNSLSVALLSEDNGFVQSPTKKLLPATSNYLAGKT